MFASLLNTRDVGLNVKRGQRVCIRMQAPYGFKEFAIREKDKIATRDLGADTTGVTIAGRGNIGTRVFTGSFTGHQRPTPYSAVGYRGKLQVCSVKRMYGSRKNVDVMDLRDIFESRTTFPDPSLLEIACVVKVKPGANEKISALSVTPTQNDSDDCLTMIEDRMPVEIYWDAMVHCSYDQVKSLVHKNERFARELAKNRYKIDSYDKTRFPTLQSLLPAVHKEAAKEFRFAANEDMWVVSFYGGNSPGMARRIPVTPGVYRWRSAAVITSLGLDVYNFRCDSCMQHLADLQSIMRINQAKTLKGQSGMKMLVLEGSETSSTDWTFCRVQDVSDGYDITVHMWENGLDRKWLQDVKMSTDKLLPDEYRSFEYFETLVFKDPVKFFGTVKRGVFIDDSTLAFLSEWDGETVGYMMKDGEFNFRVRNSGQQLSVVGMNFFSPVLQNEISLVKSLRVHVRGHVIDEQINDALIHLQKLYNAGSVDQHNAQILRDIDMTFSTIRKLRTEKFECRLPEPQSVVTEREQDGVFHVHEVCGDDFVFCTRYRLREFGEPVHNVDALDNVDAMDKIMETMVSWCSVEERDKKTLELKVIDHIGLQSMYVVSGLEYLSRSQNLI